MSTNNYPFVPHRFKVLQFKSMACVSLMFRFIKHLPLPYGNAKPVGFHSVDSIALKGGHWKRSDYDLCILLMREPCVCPPSSSFDNLRGCTGFTRCSPRQRGGSLCGLFQNDCYAFYKFYCVLCRVFIGFAAFQMEVGVVGLVNDKEEVDIPL